MKNPTGSILLISLIFIFCLSISLGFFVKIIQTAQKTAQLAYFSSKTYYLAQSGLNIAPKIAEEIPNLTTTKTKEEDIKTWLYQNLNLAKKIDQNLDGQIYLCYINNQNLYAIGIYQDKYRCLLKQKL